MEPNSQLQVCANRQGSNAQRRLTLSILNLSRISPLLYGDPEVFQAVDKLPGYVWRVSGWHQVGVCAVAIGVAILGLIPIELQRRIVNSLVEREGIEVLVLLCGIYFAVIVLGQSTNWFLKVYQSWLTQSATYSTRKILIGQMDTKTANEEAGQSVSIVGIETEKLGGFVGNQISQATANIAVLFGVVAYMFVVSPTIALFSLAFLAPQILITPIVQQWLNKLVKRHISMVRRLSQVLAGPTRSSDSSKRLALRIFRNRMIFDGLKSTMKALLNLINALAPVIVFLWGGYLVLEGQEEVGTLVAFVSGYQRLAGPTRELVQFYRVVAQTSVQHEMISEWSTDQASHNGKS